MTEFMSEERLAPIKRALDAACEHVRKSMGFTCTSHVKIVPFSKGSYVEITLFREHDIPLLEISLKGQEKHLHVEPKIINHSDLASSVIDAYNIYIAPAVAKVFSVKDAQANIHQINDVLLQQKRDIFNLMKRNKSSWIDLIQTIYLKDLKLLHGTKGFEMSTDIHKKDLGIEVHHESDRRDSVRQLKMGLSLYEKTGFFSKQTLCRVDFHFDAQKDMWIVFATEKNDSYDSAFIYLLEHRILPEIKSKIHNIRMEIHEKTPHKKKTVVVMA